MQKIPMTVRGEAQLKAELHRLKTVERPLIIQAIAEARAHGDLKENAEYHAAKEQQSFAEGRIQEVEAKLANAHVIDVSQMPNTGKVIFGTTVTLVNVDTEEQLRYQIVGDDEADVKAGKLSVNSPMARAAIGKEQGDTVTVQTPAGQVEYEIGQVDYL
jgi:transcription elongation factor GreA